LFLKVESENTHHLELVACYAYERKKFIEKRIRIGDGLTGQCALEMKTIYLTDVPADYLYITSGLGKATPRSLLIVPLLVNDEAQGVLEIASFNQYNDVEIQFVEKLAQSIASIVSNIRIEENTKHLLDQAQGQAKQMREQEEAMRQNMEELSGIHEELDRKEKDYIEKIKALEDQLASQTVSK
jgi:GAF domain-containing protein